MRLRLLWHAQDALHFWLRNKNEEGGGGYLAWNWDSSIWGADVLLATLAGATDATYAAEVGHARLRRPNDAPESRDLHTVLEAKDAISAEAPPIAALHAGCACTHAERWKGIS